MSAPNTNIDRQKKRHRPALWGMAVVAVFAGLVFFLNVAFSVDGDGPLDAFFTDDAPVLESDPEN
ncbi:hypothetical protein [Tateyamaria omphalii]|uniref:Uncharacterized protein n=1 Tax=Tateyamaria omphalii TaxID=299262 RepID=A0A1P8MR56_9RHOB|nr:hypothetical protein [Tateyamaria omphalii]APX10531.1 hypothetical protein BWR18_01575 [Tateyamaria omphalii]